jgi:type I restriction enzyme, S subunit
VMHQAKLGDFLATRARGIVPASTPDETFELYSVPAFEGKRPEVVTGGQIGSNKQIVDPGTVLLCKINPRINRAWTVGSFTKHRKIASTEWITFPPHPDLEPRYLAHYLSRKEIRDYLAANASGVGGSLMRVKASTVEDLPLPLPNVDEQRRMVAEFEKQFSRLDEAVANLKRVKANLDRYVGATLGEAFSRKWAGTEADWHSVPLREVADVQLGQQRAPVHAADVNPIPYVRAANVTWQGLELSDVKSMGFPNAARYRLAYGDILLAEASGSANEVGKPAIWRDEIPGACYQKTLIRVRCLPDRLNFEFAYYFFLHTALSGQFARLAPGVGILHLTAERMLVWPIVAPPLGIQASVVAEVDRRLSIVREVEAEVNANLKRAQALRQAVLARAFSGSSQETQRAPGPPEMATVHAVETRK